MTRDASTLVTPACWMRVLAPTRSPLAPSLEPTMLSGVTIETETPSAASASASATAIGPPSGSISATGPGPTVVNFPKASDASNHRTESSTGYVGGRAALPVATTTSSPRLRASLRSCASTAAPVRIVTPLRRHSSSSHCARSVNRLRPSPRAKVRIMPPNCDELSTSVTECPATAEIRAASIPAGPPPTTSTAPGVEICSRSSGSTVSKPALGFPTHVTTGLRGSRTRHV